MNRNFEVGKLIVENVDEKNPATIEDRSTSLLQVAVSYGYIDIFHLIFEKVEDKNPSDSYGYTPLHFAACSNFLSSEREGYKTIVCGDLSSHPCNVDDKHPVSHQGETPLDAPGKGLNGMMKFSKNQ